jgi:membrane protein required for colicin V production
MNPIDFVMLVLLGILVFIGVLKGMTRILIGIGALVAAFVLAANAHQPVADKLAFLDLPGEAISLIAYVVIFLGTMLVGALVAFLMRKLLRAAMLTWADRLAGGALGLVAATLVAGLFILPLVAYSNTGQQALRDSVLAPYVTVVADLANRWVPQGLSDSYRRKVEDLRRYWRDEVLDQASGTNTRV